MADQRPWIKLWKSFRSDPDIRRLSFEAQGRWLHLLLFIAEHGTDGSWTGPLGALVHALQFVNRGERGRQAAGKFLARLPGVTVTARDVATVSPQGGSRVAPATPIGHMEQGGLLNDPITVTVTFRNWAKYQESNSIHRTRRWRGKRHGDGQEASQASPSTASQSSPHVTRSRSRRDKNPLTPVTIVPTYPEPDPDVYRAGMESVKAILARAPVARSGDSTAPTRDHNEATGQTPEPEPPANNRTELPW